ncbi:MAG: amidohydrolase family protein [Gammaproteobacteria bacterium]|nr:amidohydrolase family protein [Gammaproteobacteria bacterium]MDD9957836.1 amidohydrolase family protein [Gammaproteobacteria bacterium]
MLIDVHTHAYTHRWLEILQEQGGDYHLKTRPDGQQEIFRGDTPVAIPQQGHFDYDLRIKVMDETGIDISIVSLTCPNVYWGTEEISCMAAQESNDSMAAAQTKYPDRIRWFTSLPWQYPDKAVEELERSVANGAAGVMVLANIDGRSLNDELFAPIWQAIDDKGIPVLLHPTDPPGAKFMDMGQFDLSWSVGFMFDTTLAITRMIFFGFFDKYPNLKMIASHGGATLPYLVGRFEKGDEVEIPSRRLMQKKPTDYLQHIYYDCITYDPRALEYLVSIVGSSQVLFGTDWPHQVFDIKGAIKNTAALPENDCEAIRHLNAKRIFDL